MVKTLKISLILVVCLLGCYSSPSPTTDATLAGAALGAGTGAIIGHQSGNAGAGAAIGAVGGAAIGGTVGYVEEQSKKTQEEDEVIRLQKLQMEKQQQEIQDLRRQQYYNDRLRRYDN